MSNEERRKREDEMALEADGRGPRPAEGGGLEVRPRNWPVAMILVSLRQWNSYGYELLERLAAIGYEMTNPGTLYRTLRQMEEQGVVESKWETSKGGPARRVYSITDAGEAYLDLWARALEQHQRNVDTFLRLYAEGSAQVFRLYLGLPHRDGLEKKDAE